MPTSAPRPGDPPSAALGRFLPLVEVPVARRLPLPEYKHGPLVAAVSGEATRTGDGFASSHSRCTETTPAAVDAAPFAPQHHADRTDWLAAGRRECGDGRSAQQAKHGRAERARN